MRESDILAEQQPLQGVFVCDHAGRVINKFSLTGQALNEWRALDQSSWIGRGAEGPIQALDLSRRIGLRLDGQTGN